MSFINKIKQALKTISIEDGLTSEDYREHFKIYVESNLKNRLALIQNWCDNTEEKFSIVAQQDTFSKRFEANITDQIDLWVRQDDALRERYTNICVQFRIKLDIEIMKGVVTEVLRTFHTDIEKHITAANKYGREWTDRLDNAGIVLLNPIIRQTITWFLNLTLQEIERDYKREVNID